jgi:hypothetical protein
MEDVKLEPDWQRPMFFDRPWQPDHVPLFAHIPFDSEIPEYLYKLDYFHLFKEGLAETLSGAQSCGLNASTWKMTRPALTID